MPILLSVARRHNLFIFSWADYACLQVCATWRVSIESQVLPLTTLSVWSPWHYTQGDRLTDHGNIVLPAECLGMVSRQLDMNK
jgi:hypothetical protein